MFQRRESGGDGDETVDRFTRAHGMPKQWSFYGCCVCVLTVNALNDSAFGVFTSAERFRSPPSPRFPLRRWIRLPRRLIGSYEAGNDPRALQITLSRSSLHSPAHTLLR